MSLRFVIFIPLFRFYLTNTPSAFFLYNAFARSYWYYMCECVCLCLTNLLIRWTCFSFLPRETWPSSLSLAGSVGETLIEFPSPHPSHLFALIRVLIDLIHHNRIQIMSKRDITMKLSKFSPNQRGRRYRHFWGNYEVQCWGQTNKTVSKVGGLRSFIVLFIQFIHLVWVNQNKSIVYCASSECPTISLLVFHIDSTSLGREARNHPYNRSGLRLSLFSCKCFALDECY